VTPHASANLAIEISRRQIKLGQDFARQPGCLVRLLPRHCFRLVIILEIDIEDVAPIAVFGKGSGADCR
jgi:hypothetical protein